MPWGVDKWAEFPWGYAGAGASVAAAKVSLGAAYVDGVRYEDPSPCVGAINQIPQDEETDVSQAVTIRLHLVSFLNAEIE